MATYKAPKLRHVIVSIRVPEALRDVLQGVLEYVRHRQCHWQVRCVDADQFNEILQKSPTDGAITTIGTPDQQPVVGLIKSLKIPVVNIVHDCHPVVPSVVSNEAETGRLAAEHLMSRGYRSFAYLGFDARWSRQRETGFVDALAADQRTSEFCAAFRHTSDFRFLESSRAAKKLVSWLTALPKPVGIMACSDYVAATAIDICMNAGLRVPEDLAFIGVGNQVATCEMAPVPLSSVAVNFVGMGFHAARLLDDLFSGKGPPTAPYVIAPPGLVSRRSTDIFTFEDEYVRTAMQIIHDRAATGLTMKELLRQIPVSRRWLDAQFKLHIGHTPSREMRKLRLERLRDLLVTTDLDIEQIARTCGFSRSENLNRFFRDAFGMPPGSYRLKYAVRPSTARR